MRKEINVDEASIVERISNRERSLKASIPQQEEPAQPLPVEGESPPLTEEKTDVSEYETKAPPPRRESSKRKRGQAEYGDVFLKRKEFKTRQSVYISQEVHASIARLVHVLALTGNEISVGGYIDNVLSEHLESYKEVFSEMYRKQLDQLL